MKKIFWKNLSKEERQQIMVRPASIISDEINKNVRAILNDVRTEGEGAVRRYTIQFDGYDPSPIYVSFAEIKNAAAHLSADLRAAIDIAYLNINKFHAKQGYASYEIETYPGIVCTRLISAIERIGLYIPGGSAPLFSTVLMLGVPSQIAGNCERILCTPGNKNGEVHAAILYAAHLCGIEKIIRVGGAQAIALMAYGTESIAPVAKIFGPGNLYVSVAKSIVSQNFGGPAIDMPAGPSEVLVIVDDKTPPAFAAADLLAQAEHDVASQVILVSISEAQADAILFEIEKQITVLPRAEIVRQALKQSLIIIAETLGEGIEISNLYAPEHLILCFDEAHSFQSAVKNAGSVFCGIMTPESLGDYASGTNHVLPTAGSARGYSGVSVESFQKTISWQQASAIAAQNINEHIVTMANAEGLEGHANSMLLRKYASHD